MSAREVKVGVVLVLIIQYFCLHLQQSTSSSCHSSPEVQFPWQQQNSLATRPVEFPGNNNNLNYLPCSSQCDSSRTLNPNFAGRLSIQAYASHNGIDEEDLSGYNPELSVAQNPHYYHINNILYNAHVEKAKRYDAGCKFTWQKVLTDMKEICTSQIYTNDKAQCKLCSQWKFIALSIFAMSKQSFACFKSNPISLASTYEQQGLEKHLPWSTFFLMSFILHYLS